MVEVFDLAALLGGTSIVGSAGNVVLVLALDNPIVGILVDAVSDIVQAPANSYPCRGQMRARSGAAS